MTSHRTADDGPTVLPEQGNATIAFARAPKMLHPDGSTGKPLGQCRGWVPSRPPEDGIYGYATDDVFFLEVRSHCDLAMCRRCRAVACMRVESCLELLQLIAGQRALLAHVQKPIRAETHGHGLYHGHACVLVAIGLHRCAFWTRSAPMGRSSSSSANWRHSHATSRKAALLSCRSSCSRPTRSPQTRQSAGARLSQLGTRDGMGCAIANVATARGHRGIATARKIAGPINATLVAARE